MAKKLLQTRNPGKTSLTHVKDASGFWYVHDGSEEKNVVVKQDGTRLEQLPYPEARRGKDYAVSILKMRTAGILKHEDNAPIVHETPAPAPAPAKAPDPKALEQQLAQMRAPAINAATAAATAAQARHDAQKRQQEMADKAKTILKSVPALDSLDELPDGDGDLEEGELDPSLSVDDELGLGLGLSADDAAHAKEQAAKDVAESELAGKILFATENGITSDDQIEKLWAGLDDKVRAALRWRATNETADSKQVPTATTAPLRQ